MFFFLFIIYTLIVKHCRTYKAKPTSFVSIMCVRLTRIHHNCDTYKILKYANYGC